MRTAAALLAWIVCWTGAAAQAPPLVEGLRAAVLEMAESMERMVDETVARLPAAERDAVCQSYAAAMAAARGAAMDGIDLRRIATDARNPANRPDGWEADGLRRLSELSRGTPPEALEWAEEVDAGGGARMLRYLRGIAGGGRCRECHAGTLIGAFSARRPM